MPRWPQMLTYLNVCRRSVAEDQNCDPAVEIDRHRETLMTILVDRHWEHFPHQGDVGVRGIGPTKAAAFEEAAAGLVAIVADPTGVAPCMRISLRCQAPNDDMLFVDWLNALIFEMDTRRMLFSRFDVQIDADVLTASAWGEAIDPARHDLGTQVKGATYTCLAIGWQSDGAWHAQCVVDV